MTQCVCNTSNIAMASGVDILEKNENGGMMRSFGCSSNRKRFINRLFNKNFVTTNRSCVSHWLYHPQDWQYFDSRERCFATNSFESGQSKKCQKFHLHSL